MGRTVLYVDPDPATRLLIRKVLEPEGFTVLEAENARDGRESVQRARPDIILVDVDQVKPADFLAPLRQTSGMERIAILACTARAWPHDPDGASGWGFERVLLKPVDIDQLAGDLGAYLPAPPMPTTDLEAVESIVTDDDALARPGLGEDNAGTIEMPAQGERLGFIGAGVADGADTGDRPVGASVADVVDDLTHDESLDAGIAPEAPVPPLLIEMRDVPLVWRLNLTPVAESFVRAIPTTHGVVALLDETETALTLVAAASLRPLTAEPAVGTRVPLPLVPWVHPVLETRQPAVFPTASLEVSPLVPAESTVILVVPIASTDRVHGVVILGEQRNPKFAPFAPAKIAQSVGEARHIASVVEALRQLDTSAHHRREELHQARLEMARTLLGSVKEHLRSRRSRRGEPGRERSRRLPPLPAELAPVTRLTLDLGARLGLEPSQREPLRQAIEALDIGRAWLEELLFPRAGLSEEEAAALLETQAEHSAALLEALDWPARALALVRAHGAWWDGAGHPPGLTGSSIPLGARILSVMSAYARAMGSNADGATPAPRDVMASLRREAGTRFDPGVIDALAALVIPSTE